MHLIVMRRNNIPVPDTLPARLVPKIDSRFSQRAVTTDLVDLGSDMFGSGTSADFNFAPKQPDEAPPSAKLDRRSSSPVKTDAQLNNKEWTKFVDSPTSSVSSPGPKPVNFDFHKSAVERDPKIYHPVALRVTPDAGDGEPRSSASPRRDDIALAFEPASPKRHSSPAPADIKSVQRPQPKKPLKSAGVLPPPPARDDGPQSLQLAPRKEPPPPPPPRPLRHHARSSSLDLNRLKSAPLPPPQPPPRMEPAFPPDCERDAPKMHGAFEVYRKPASREQSCEGDPELKSLQEQNAVLLRVCRALCSELADVQRDREQLRVRLEHTL